jgi:threonine dehydratase
MTIGRWAASAEHVAALGPPLAGGIATRVPIPEALEAMEGRIDDMVLVSDEALRAAQDELTAALGVTVEGGGAASWAAILAAADGSLVGPALVIVTGSNAEAP